MALQNGDAPRCEICRGEATFTVCVMDYAYCECACGHTWREDYTDPQGCFPRPKSTVSIIEDIMNQDEIALYRQILSEINNDKSYYLTAAAEDILEKLTETCQAGEQKIAAVLIKVSLFHKAMKGG